MVNTINEAPVFPDQDDEMEGRQTAQERLVGENVPVEFGGNQVTALDRPIGAPVDAKNDDGGAVTYSLGGPDAASFSIERASGQLMTKAVLDKETEDTYTVTVTATDSLDASSTITVTIKVTNVDERPELEGEAPEEYAENGTSAVATFRATDPEGKSITWDVDGNDAGDFRISSRGVLTFASSPDYEVAADQGSNNEYEVTIQASDGGATTTATKAVTIAITNVEEPGTVTLDTLQPQVGVELTATLTDPDSVTDSTVTWQWYRGSSAIATATIGAVETESMYTPAAGDVGSTLRAQAMYDDGEGDDKTARENSYRNVRSAPVDNTAPVFPTTVGQGDTNQTRKVAENTPAGRNIGAPVAANDPGDVLTYSLDPGSDAMVFAIVRSSGQLQTKGPLDFEGTSSTYTVTVTATDPFGPPATPATSEVVITVTNVNEAPMLTGGATSIDLAENGTDLDDDATSDVMEDEFTVTDEDIVDVAADLRWSLSGADASKFEFASPATGAMRTLSLKAAPNYESPADSGRDNVYAVTVKVTDTKGNSDEKDVTVKVTNMEETGTVTLSTLQPRVGFPVTATLTDPDNITAGSVSWQWYRGTVAIGNIPEECAATTGDNCAIKDAASDTYTPIADDVNDTLSAVAMYTDGRPNTPADAKDVVVMPAANPVLADTRNKAPFFPDQDDEMEGEQTDQERSIGENVPAIGGADATVLVREIPGPVVAMDFITANDGTPTAETLTYTLGGPDADSFTIDRGTARISTKAELDTETKDTYMVTVTATDPSGLTATINVTIKVTGVDEAPEITVGGLAVSGTTRVDYAEDRHGRGGDVQQPQGRNRPTAMWTLGGDDMSGDFEHQRRRCAHLQECALTTRTRRPPTWTTTYMVTVKARRRHLHGHPRSDRHGDQRGRGDRPVTDGTLLEPGMTPTPRTVKIDKSEVITAINDYQDKVEGTTKADVITLINHVSNPY